MKIKAKKLAAVCAASLLGTLAASAHSDEQSQNQQQSGSATPQSGQPQPAMGVVRLSKLMDASVKSKSGEDLGQVEDFLINPRTGRVDYAVLGRGGFLGMGEQRIPVPWSALSIQSQQALIVSVDKQKLKSAPTLNSDYTNQFTPDYEVTIYRFYEIPSSAIGGGESPGGMQRGGGQSESNAPAGQGR